MRLIEEQFSLVKKFAVESCLIDGIKDPIDHVTCWVGLCTLLNKKKLTLKNVTEFAKSICPDIKLYNGKKARELKEILLWAKTKNATDSYQLHNQFTVIAPYSKDIGRISRALWLWRAWRFEKYRCQISFHNTYYIQSLEQIVVDSHTENEKGIGPEVSGETSLTDENDEV